MAAALVVGGCGGVFLFYFFTVRFLSCPPGAAVKSVRTTYGGGVRVRVRV